MPFNMAMAGVGGRSFILAITAEDLAINYDVEAQISSQFPSAAPTRAADVIKLTISAVDLVASSTSVYAIDGDGLHDDAILNIILISGAFISGLGGKGGRGGDGDFEIEPEPLDLSTVGSPGLNGGAAMRFGCETNISGTGTISKGYAGGGGGGGGATSGSQEHGGGGGGGGSALGDGGAGGIRIGGGAGGGSSGDVATVTAKGDGGAAGGANAGAGGDGGDSAGVAVNGSNGTKAGGSAGSDGNAVNSQGFTHSEGGSVTVVGNII